MKGRIIMREGEGREEKEVGRGKEGRIVSEDRDEVLSREGERQSSCLPKAVTSSSYHQSVSVTITSPT
jgi:hypothetical protein